MSWFRLHERVLDDPKVAKLSDALFRSWVKVLCLASKHKGSLPHDLRDVAYSLRLSERKARGILDDLIKAGLLDECDDQLLRAHDWSDWQYQSDSSTERSQRCRERKRNVAATPSDTEQSRADTEAEQKNQELLAVSLLPDWIPPGVWDAYLEMRRKKRAYPTEHAKALLIKKLGQFKEQGYSIQVVLEQSITSNWTDIFPPRQQKQEQGNGKVSNVQKALEALRSPTGDDGKEPAGRNNKALSASGSQ